MVALVIAVGAAVGERVGPPPTPPALLLVTAFVLSLAVKNAK